MHTKAALSKTLSVQFSQSVSSVVQFYARPKVVWAPLATLQDDSARGPERFGRRWRLSRMSLREAPSGLGATGAPPEQFYARPRVVWASLASLNNDSPFGFHKLQSRFRRRHRSRPKNQESQPAIFLYSFLLTTLL